MSCLIGTDRLRICRKYAGSIGPIGVIGISEKMREIKTNFLEAIGQYFNRSRSLTRLKPIRGASTGNRIILLNHHNLVVPPKRGGNNLKKENNTMQIIMLVHVS